MREEPRVREAGRTVHLAESTAAKPPDTPALAYRHDKSTSTSAVHGGGEIEYHLSSPSLWHLLFLLGTPILCFLNGCSYYLYWRSRYLEAAAAPHNAASGSSTPSSPFLSASPIVLTSSASSIAPRAFYGVTAGFAFSFVFSQWVVQESVCVFIRVHTERQRAASFRRCGLLFVAAFLPSTVAQMVLIGQDYHLLHDQTRLLRLVAASSDNGTPSAVRALLFSASHGYVALWIVTFFLTMLSVVVMVSAMWTDAAVSLLQRRVFAAFLRGRPRRQRVED
ncbi:hypothetical protein ABB37_00493 [Leptomonas pyrrhocoris]|uniref:Transmembrane protein n=1 Tax=Leptomonas pyrrhocoris TaxID=157538 RepID=A0A0N1J5G5_LEPPY|nr:hypothetical protein ABB37_00493 [Leptomonas pyrrhocoris]KPA86264.1 hypothetical protein ABB37_00493 [Leptomonas pyrrhocoris]|eukprot:XP_015664703.1 hypothetical protein ABB37_00493 [Leptomonas pyrrhocoris]